MRTRPAFPFNKSLLAAAVIIASGCATTGTPDNDNGDGAGFSGPLVDAGRATADLTSRAWRRTGYILGLTDESDDAGAVPPMDEVDLAMLEEDAVMPGDAVIVAGVQRIDAVAADGTDRLVISETLPENGQPFADEDLAVARFVAVEDGATSDVDGVRALGDAAVPPGTPSRSVVALNDYTHTVGSDETLWDIAKKTTGDATNWHALADVNDLGQNASVYPGQDLTIPADMLRPELVDTIVAGAMPTDGTVPVTAREDEPVELAAAQPQAPAAALPVAAGAVAPSEGARGFTVQSGESLWEFARRTTGDATEWQVIAAHNGFDEQRAVAIRQGEEIFVPEALVRAELGGTEDASKPEQGALQVDRAPSRSQNDEGGEDGGSAGPRMVPIVAASEALPAEPALAAAATPVPDGAAAMIDEVLAPDEAPGLDETRDMTIVEASFNESAAEQFSPSTDEAPDGAPDEIVISGTYYPKAVYNSADFSSSLLMRVSPGTRLRVAGVKGSWYAVETDDGTGYVHDRDIK